jgi:hypothetical protein
MPQLFDQTGDDTNAAVQSTFEEVFADRNRFREEINDQLRAHIVAHMQLKGRKPTDFVKPRMSEATAYDMKKYSVANHVANLEDGVAAMAEQESAEDETFDREAFAKMKEELRQRKAAKESLLSGNMPQFKTYLRF